MPEAEWEPEAGNWVRWARAPGHDEYWYYREFFFDEIVPSAGRRTLDVGCGEGRVTRDLAARGHEVVALDLSPSLLRHARASDPTGCYTVADGAALPFSDDAFDVVVAYNSLMDMIDMQAAVREVARVLVHRGTFCVCVSHPLNDVGTFADNATFVIGSSYLVGHRFEGTAERDGLAMTFRGWTHPIEDYAKALEYAGMHIACLREPAAPAGTNEFELWQDIPMFLYLRAVNP
jgi:SAM-dependent methyltransferase